MRRRRRALVPRLLVASVAGVLAAGLLSLGTIAADRAPAGPRSAPPPTVTLVTAAPSAVPAAPAPATGWEARAPDGPVHAPRREPIPVAPDLGAVDPSTWLAGSALKHVLPDIRDRRFVTPPSPWLPAPATVEFIWSIEPVPDRVLRRSTWHEECPVTRDELRWVRVPHVGFDGRAHAGELLVHRDAAEGMVEVFRRLYAARYPIERMQIAGGPDLLRRAWWHGDGNDTTAFVCRQSVAGGRWSQHAYGLAVDINPFHNPYIKDDVLIPSHAHHYVERDGRPGVIRSGDAVDRAFVEELGWYWGGRWTTALDYMHFSWNDW